MDEVHKIEDEEAYEHLLHLLPCPYVALSATLGNAHEFHAWLASNTSRPPPQFIAHHERATLLKYYKYHSGGSRDDGLGDHGQAPAVLEPVNPLLHLFAGSTHALPANEFERRLSAVPPLTSSQLLQLWVELERRIASLESRIWASFGQEEREQAVGALIGRVDRSLDTLSCSSRSTYQSVSHTIATLRTSVVRPREDGGSGLGSIEARLFAEHVLQWALDKEEEEAEAQAAGGVSEADEDAFAMLTSLRARLQEFSIPEAAAWSAGDALHALMNRTSPQNFAAFNVAGGGGGRALARNSVRALDKAIR